MQRRTRLLARSPGFVDLVHEGVDVAVRAHYGPLPDSDYAQRRLGFSPNYPVASPAYLALRGKPSAPEDLADHDAIQPTLLPAEAGWTLVGPKGEARWTMPRPRFFADDPITSMKATLSGLGVANLPHGLCWPDIEAGRLVRLLPDWSAGGATMTLLVPHRRGQLPCVRILVDFRAQGLAAKMVFQ